MKNYIKKIVFITTTAIFLNSCVDENYNIPTDSCVNPGLTKNKEVATIYTVATNTTQIYATDDIIEGYVVSSDEGGNFYQSMYVQPTDGSKGFNISVGEGNLYLKGFQPGKKIYLKMKGLAYANPSGFARGLLFGAPPTSIFAVDRISDLEYKKFMIPSCDAVSEDAIVSAITLTQANADTYLNKLVEFDNVQFIDEYVGATYDPNRTDAFDASITITNGTQNFVVRTSRYANFAGSEVPAGRGKIRGVLTKYNSTYQIILRTERDVNLPNQRIDYSLPLVGNAITFNSTFNETFESYAVSSTGITFPNYVNDAIVGSRYWDVKSFSNNKYIQMATIFGGGFNKTVLMMPITFTAGSKLSFKSKDGFFNGSVLKVYYTTNYVPGSIINTANFVDITSSFTISSGSTSTYASNFTNSGNFTIPASLTGNGFFVFEYSGTPTITTIMQLDDIKVIP